jgi:hypothetical protein
MSEDTDVIHEETTTKFELEDEVESLDAVPEKLRRFYLERDGKHVLRDPASLEQAHKNAKASEQAAKRELQAARERLEKYSALDDVDVEEYRKMKQEKIDREVQEAEKKGQWDKLRAQMQEQHAEELKTRETEVERLRNELRNEKIDSKLQEALLSQEVTSVGAKLLPYELKKKIDFVEEDGKFAVRILGEDGKTARVNADGEYLQISDLVKEAREEFPDLFKGSAASGGGAPNQSGGNGALPRGKVKAAKDMTDVEKSAFIAENGLEAWKELLGV